MATGWIIASAPDETDANSAITGYWDGGEFSSDVNAAIFFSDTTNTIQGVRVDECGLQATFSDGDVRIVPATRSLTQATDSDAGNGWVIGAAPDESSAIDQYLDGAGFVPSIDDAGVFSKADGENIESVRQEEGRFQSLFADVDIRIVPVNTVTTIA